MIPKELILGLSLKTIKTKEFQIGIDINHAYWIKKPRQLMRFFFAQKLKIDPFFRPEKK